MSSSLPLVIKKDDEHVGPFDHDRGMSVAQDIARSHGWCMEGHKSCDKWPDCECPGFVYMMSQDIQTEEKDLAPKEQQQ